MVDPGSIRAISDDQIPTDLPTSTTDTPASTQGPTSTCTKSVEKNIVKRPRIFIITV